MSRPNLKTALLLATVVVLLLIEFFMFNDYFYPFRLLWSEGQVFELTLSVVLLAWSLLGVFLIFLSGRSLLRRITLPFFLFFFLFNIGSFNISNSPIDFQQADLIVSYFQWWLGAAAENFGLAALPLLLILIPVIVFVERLPDRLEWRLPGQFYLVPVSALFLVFAGLHYSNGLVDRYPSFFRVPALLMFAGHSQLYDGERDEVAYAGALAPQVDKVILIIDESIRADILGVNGYPQETTPFLRSLEGGVVNFGRAAASTNCSDYSNLVLRSGIGKGAIPDEEQLSLRQPSIWQFTREAGFYNVYIDAQSAEAWGNFQNFMNGQEAPFIDAFYRVRQEPAYESDGVALEQLVEQLEKPGRDFIVLNKYGLHFPYFRSYPDDYSLFTPALAPGEPMHDRERSLNSYMNGLRWAVDAWFKTLLSNSSGFQRYVIIYTSDHGQNIADDGALATHCRPRATRFEGLVPMMVFSNVPELLQRFDAAQLASHDTTSHFQVFPTLLQLAGYDGPWVRNHYGASLSEPPGTLPEFFAGDLHGRGSVRQWISILPSDAD